MKILREKDIVDNMICEFQASGKTNASVQVKFANHFDNVHRVQRSQLSPEILMEIDKKAFEILSRQT